jgi:hypothetical protein
MMMGLKNNYSTVMIVAFVDKEARKLHSIARIVIYVYLFLLKMTMYVRITEKQSVQSAWKVSTMCEMVVAYWHAATLFMGTALINTLQTKSDDLSARSLRLTTKLRRLYINTSDRRLKIPLWGKNLQA